ncbi:uncharacterized protein LOC106135354 [Amyelois transitella]|uniref:uncharacterized protein LOC106135354 n=1 Tax=Amyelois transitella TaxID=680683 RepID=UPI00298FE0A3|nr:uncharacterized protein LOC106135354 [Amyelois transitella]
MRTLRRRRAYTKASWTFKGHTARRRRKYHANSIFMHDSTMRDFNLDNFNEVIRTHKSRRDEWRGAWRVMPKDSCEVYRKRQRKNEEREETEHSSDEQTDTDEPMGRKMTRKLTDRKNGRNARRTARKRRRYKQRNNDDSSVSSHSTTHSSTCTSYSEMDYGD